MHMNNTHKIIIAVVVILLILLGVYLYSKNAEAPMEVTPEGVQSGPTSLRALVDSTESQKCTFTNTYDGGSSEGTVYVSRGMVRGDFSSTVADSQTKVVSHMITDGVQMRIWQEGEKTGIIMEIPSSDANADPQGQQSPLSYNDPNVNYQCERWPAEQSYFIPPVDVSFQSLSDMMRMNMPSASGSVEAGTSGTDRGMGPGMEAIASPAQMKELQCNACDQAPDEVSKAQCRAALECS